ncbi:DUF6712 family protein [Spirosoma aerophilum]
MAQPLQWLNLASFSGRITLPTNFNISVFNPFLLDLEETELPALLGTDRLTRLRAWLLINPLGVISDPDAEPNIEFLTLYPLVAAFLVYASYAAYLIEGDVQATDTGAVVKERDSSEPLSDVRIMQLYRSNKDKANARKVMIRDYIDALGKSCSAPVSGGDLRISSSRGRKASILDQ